MISGIRFAFYLACFFALVAPAWAGGGAPLEALPNLDGQALALLGGAGLVSDAVRRLERWRPVLRIEMVPVVPTPPGPEEAVVKATEDRTRLGGWVPRVVSSLAILVGGGVGCLSSTDGDSGLKTQVVLGCANAGTWSAFWSTAEEDVGQVSITLHAGGVMETSTSTLTCGELTSSVPCGTAPVYSRVEVHNVGVLLSCAETSTDGTGHWGDCPWTATYTPCGS